jgi:hypothetical protein
MCCFAFPTPTSLIAALFTRPVRVSKTQIYARLDGDHQLVAYAMNLRTSTDVAMILPLPVRPGTDEPDVQFVDLSGAKNLFHLLHEAFSPPMMTAAKRGGFSLPDLSRSRPPLVVRDVGAFEASFVPTVDDFDRLDPRFRLPTTVWSQLPVHDFGFAVFKLRSTSGPAEIHPMAFRFPTRDPGRIFFPTLHVHDGKAHATARFDHALYYQRDDGSVDGDHDTAWLDSAVTEASSRSAGFVLADRPLARAVLQGKRTNADTWFSGLARSGA